MKSTTSTTVSPSGSSSHQKKTKTQQDEVIALPGILVNQAHVKIKLEDNIPAPIKIETDSDSNQATSESHEGEAFTEEFVVTKENFSFRLPEEPGQGQHQQVQSSSCACQQEISSLKDAVNELTLQVQKQNQVITGLKSGLRNAVLSLMTCCQDEKEDGGLQDSCHDNYDVHESIVIVNTSSKACETNVEDPLFLENSENFSGIRSCQNTEDVDMDDDDENADVHDGDSSYVPGESEEEADKEMEDEHNRQRNQLKAAKISTVNSEGRFECSQCGKNYKLKRYLREHKRKAHFGQVPPIKCDLCPKVFTSKQGIREHIDTIHKGIRHKCDHCPGTFSYNSHLVRHKRVVHKEGGPPTQQCTICGVHLANSKRSLQNHMSLMHESSERTSPSAKFLSKKGNPETVQTKRFHCQYCTSSFVQLNDLHCHLSESHLITPAEPEAE